MNVGRVLSLVTIAEGIEHASQLTTVKKAGCDLVQDTCSASRCPTMTFSA